MELDNFLWVERYRPKTISDCILPDRMKNLFQEYVDAKEIPNLLLDGTAGVGKTTVAKALCEEVGCDYMVINGSDENGVDTVRFKIKNYASAMSLTGGRKVIIIDEADYLSPNAQAAFRNSIEEFSSNCSFIFTCNYKTKIIEPLHSRCAVIEFSLKNNEKAKMAAQFFKRVQFILKSENIIFDDKVIAEVIKKYFPDFRRVINELQRYSKFGSIDVGILPQINNTNIKDLVKILANRDFNSMRKWVVNNDVDYNSIYRQVYDALDDVLVSESIPIAIEYISEYMGRAALSNDNEINFVAFLSALMADCTFKS
jgi:replication factor C small subunit